MKRDSIWTYSLPKALSCWPFWTATTATSKESSKRPLVLPITPWCREMKQATTPPKFRLKVNTTGLQAAKFWDTERKMLGHARDVSTKGTHIVPVICFTKAWFMNRQHGITAELRHAILTSASNDDAPF